MLIADARQGLTALDEQLLGWYAPTDQPVLVLLTKSDKLPRQQAQAALNATETTLSARYPAASAQLFSSVTGTGAGAAQRVIQGWLK